MNDRELLEAAAKAAGYLDSDTGYGELSGGWPVLYVSGVGVWDPLGDDGDALRLAVKLRLCLFLELPRIGIGPMINGPEAYVEDGEDEMAATRRAIVRAAATMAQTKETP